MKTLFIPVTSKSKITESKILEISKKLPKSIAIAYSIQYKDTAQEIKKILSKTHKTLSFLQVLGCSSPKFPKSIQAILLITDGKFHAVSLGLKTKLPIYILNNHSFGQISKQEIQLLETKQKASYVNFLNSNKIGILISNKPGQQNLKGAINLKNKLKDKTSYLFISNEINSLELENFPQIQSWVNTACPRLDMASQVINIKEI